MFLLSGVLAEIFMRELGFNKGMGGSMHAFFTPFGTFQIMQLLEVLRVLLWALLYMLI